MYCNLAPELRAHVSGLRPHPHSSKVKSVGVPASTNRRVLTQTAMGVPCASVVEKLEVRVAQLEQHTTQPGGIGCAPCAVGIVPTIMLSSRIMEDREQAHDLLDGSTPFGDQQG